MMRIYGNESETLPPIVLMQTQDGNYWPPIGELKITIEFDVESLVPPSLYAKFVHCSVDWKENENVFLNDIVNSRTSNIMWESAPMYSKYFTWRGKIKVPSEQVKFQFAGNWKVKLYEYYKDSVPFAEGRFFVVNPKTECNIQIYTNFYEPVHQVSGTALDFEAIVTGSQQLFESHLNTVVIYRNNRFEEPFIITKNDDLQLNKNQYRYKYRTAIGGFVSGGKRFRIEGIPAENEYRVLDLTDMASYPRITAPVRFPMSDLRRNGTWFDEDDDGAMITRFITSSNDDYVYLEFLFNPDGWISDEEVFVVGSFNNWKPDASWQMYYDPDERVYKLRHWVRRARHNYLYATGKYNIDSRVVESISYEEYEGNTATSGHTYIALVYYREFDYGGYDALIGVGASTIRGFIRR